ncbi:molybdopterin-dependent oxidoreductase [Micromonospora sp. NBC_01796]|uniref:molybdopterin-dependent oxidoreductase n=1 Tax=Micromonospora sp. NBC_01796 TaxID=2975987 RepID=UPI002DD9FE7A|nr:molybdopterin-dependent oxidoreductase [Micromonospora sp. NBC_01796]WSA84959.1 molybdopterin-dependent oxidoreductase [Micromonospora sp. NBC_01796]
MPRESDFTAPAHDVRVAARLGLALGVTFGLCFATGLLSHIGQHGSWWPTRPVDFYRITQGVHVLSGIVAVPLLLAKLWSVYPRLFARPVIRSLPHALERVALLVLLAAAFFQLATGLFNSAQSYPWPFQFVPTHYAVAWVAIGAIGIHIATKLPLIHDGLSRPVGPTQPGRSGMSRRGFLTTTGLAAVAALVATAGATVPWLYRVSPLSWRAAKGPQGVPINRTANAARVSRVGADWRLTVRWPGGSRALDRVELANLPQHTARLPIACVEGWSASATWTGVTIVDLLGAVGAPTGRVEVESLERSGPYRTSVLLPDHVRDPLTLLALRINGEELTLDHGYPCRIIAPTRPGVLQTKWVTALRVRP